MRILVCDDDSRIREFIKDCTIDFFDTKKLEIQISTYGSVGEAKDKMQSDTFDIYFLDIELVDGSGIELAKTIRLTDKKGCIVFITSHSEFMPDAFGVHAYQYLQKPITEQAIVHVLGQLYEYLIETKQAKEKFFFQFNKERYSLDYDKIVAFTSELRMNEIISSEGMYEYYGKFKELTNQLPKNQFVAIRNNFIINMDYIKNVSESVIYYEIPNKLGLESVNISKGFRNNFNKAFAEYMENGNY